MVRLVPSIASYTTTTTTTITITTAILPLRLPLRLVPFLLLPLLRSGRAVPALHPLSVASLSSPPSRGNFSPAVRYRNYSIPVSHSISHTGPGDSYISLTCTRFPTCADLESPNPSDPIYIHPDTSFHISHQPQIVCPPIASHRHTFSL